MFNENSLEKAIYETWGEYGAHADVWREIKKRLSEGDGWISVEKELPKAGHQVMAFNGFSHQVYLGSWLNGKWIFHGQERGNITHWMPLPAPPNK